MRPKHLDEVIVSLDTPENAAYWLEHFNISMPALQLAMIKAGNRYNDIREELGIARVYFFPRDDEIMQRFVGRGLISPATC